MLLFPRIALSESRPHFPAECSRAKAYAAALTFTSKGTVAIVFKI